MHPDDRGTGGGEVVTILFTDVQGSTELGIRMGDDAAREVLRAHDELVREQIAAHGGREIKTTGDGFMVSFSSPRRAVSCAAGIHAAIDRYVRADPNRELLVRIGVHTGEAQAEAGDLFGTAVNAAARVAAAAKGGETLVTDVVRQLAGSVAGITFTDRGSVRLKGFDESWQLFVAVPEAAPQPAAGPLARTPFVGRADQRAALRDVLDRALAGHGSMVMIGGEPGVGKTRLTEEVCSEASKRQMRIRVGRCKDMEGTPPFLPFVEILEAALADAPSIDQFRAALGEDAAEVARVMPRLRRVFPDIPAPLELPPQQERQYLLNSFRDYVVRAAGARPIVAVFEDLQWADESSLALLEHLAPSVAHIPLVVLCTYRDVELDVSRPLAHTLETLIGQRLAHRMPLKRLPAEAVATMVRALAGQEAPPALSKIVFDETEGNPFFVEEVFRHLADEGKLFDSHGRFRADLKIADTDVPESVRLTIGRRLQRLNPTTRRVLTCGAAMGRDFSFHILESLGEVTGDELLEAVDEAIRCHLVEAKPAEGEARYTFVHELIRQTLLSEISTPRRINLHLRLAQTMERVYASSLEAHAADIANHLLHAAPAADRDTAARFHLLAGQAAMTAGAYEDALQHFDRAQSTGSSDPRLRADLYRHLGMAHRGMGRSGDARACWEKALDQCRELGDADAVRQLYGQVTREMIDMGQAAEALDFGQRGLAEISSAVHTDRCHLLAAMGLAASFACDHQLAHRLITDASRMADELGEPSAHGYCAFAKSAHHYLFSQCEDALDAGLEGVEILRRVGNVWDLAATLAVVVTTLRAMGRHAEAATTAEEAEPLAARLGSVLGQGALHRSRSPVGITSAAALDGYRREINAQIDIFQRAASAWLSGPQYRLGLVQFWQGEWDEAIRTLSTAAPEAPGAVGGFGAFLPMLQAYAGSAEDAVAGLALRRGDYARRGQPNSQAAWSVTLIAVEAMAVAGDRAGAAALYPTVLEAIETGNVGRVYDFRLVETIAGIAAGAGARWDLAEGHFCRAVKLADSLAHPIEQADARRLFARMLLDRRRPGDVGAADVNLAEALRIYRAMGMTRHGALAEEMIREASAPTPPPGQPMQPHPDGLTGREIEVLALLAAGRTSGEMAAQLCLSVATVQRHVANIYLKIGARNRAEATAYALQGGLNDRRRASAPT